MSDKYDNIASDERRRTEALHSWYRLKENSDQIHYTQQVDVYAFAITMFEMLNHQPPWDAENHASHGSVTDITTTDIYRKVSGNLRPYTPPDVQHEAQDGWVDLMCQCWDDDAKSRPSFDYICTAVGVMLSRLPRYAFHQAFHENFSTRPKNSITHSKAALIELDAAPMKRQR